MTKVNEEEQISNLSAFLKSTEIPKKEISGLKDLLLEKIEWLLNLNQSKSEEDLERFIKLLDLDTDINWIETENKNNTTHSFSLTKEWEEKLETFQKQIIIENLLKKEINKEKDFSWINNAINAYNKDKSDDTKIKTEVITEDDISKLEKKLTNKALYKEKDIQTIKKAILKLEKNREKKYKFEWVYNSISNINVTDEDINLLSESLNLKNELSSNFKNNKEHNFQYDLIIDKEKEIKSYKIGEPIVEPSVLEKLLKYKKSVLILVWLAWFYWIFWNNWKQVELNLNKDEIIYNPFKKEYPQNISAERLLTIKSDVSKIIELRVNTIIKEVFKSLKENKYEWRISEVQKKLLETKIDELNNDLSKKNNSNFSLFIEKDFKIKWEYIIWEIYIIFNKKSIKELKLKIPIKKTKN